MGIVLFIYVSDRLSVWYSYISKLSEGTRNELANIGYNLYYKKRKIIFTNIELSFLCVFFLVF